MRSNLSGERRPSEPRRALGLRRKRARLTCDDLPYRLYQLLKRDRLGQVDVETRVEAPADVGVAAVAGQRNAASAVSLQRSSHRARCHRESPNRREQIEKSSAAPRVAKCTVQSSLHAPRFSATCSDEARVLVVFDK